MNYFYKIVCYKNALVKNMEKSSAAENKDFYFL